MTLFISLLTDRTRFPNRRNMGKPPHCPRIRANKFHRQASQFPIAGETRPLRGTPRKSPDCDPIRGHDCNPDKVPCRYNRGMILDLTYLHLLMNRELPSAIGEPGKILERGRG